MHGESQHLLGITMSDVPRHEPPEDARPWERPGAVRRDVESDHADLLWWLATISVACGATALVLAVTGLAGLALGLAAFCLARRDLRAMAAGRVDPAGQARTRRAKRRAELGMELSAIGLVGFWVFWCMGLFVVKLIGDLWAHRL